MELGTPVDVFRNLNHGGYSVRSRRTSDYGTVIARVESICIDDPEFVVQPAGRQKVIETGVKNVHAFVRGTVDRLEPIDGVPVTYRPTERGSFYRTDTNEPVDSAERAYCHDDGVSVEL